MLFYSVTRQVDGSQGRNERDRPARLRMLYVRTDRRLIRRIVNSDDAIFDLNSFAFGTSNEFQHLSLSASLAFQLLSNT